MQDSTITYKVTTQGIAEAEAQFNALGATIKNVTINQNGSVTASGQLTKEQAALAEATNQAGNATQKASKAQSSYVGHIAKTTVLSAFVNKAFLSMVDAAGQAVKQVDLFTNFPASMAALGLSSKDASDSLLVLRDYAARTGISLSEATTSVARFAEVTKNVKAATAEFVGVKNALIAGGAGAEVQSNALEQLIQSYSRGKPQLIEWRSLMVAMPAQLNQVAKAMNLPNAQALGEQLTQGKVSMQDFVTELTKLSTGTGPIANQAIARMQGIEFAGNVLKNALVNGLAAIYQAVGRQNIISVFSFMTQVIKILAGWVVVLINDLITLFNWVSKIFGGPQISHFSGEAANAAGALGTGAANAGDMADGLGDAADNAAKINKSLASFDKMNVLPDKTSDSKDKGAGGTGPLDPATAGALEDIFGKIGGSLQEASKWAKIFAGILSGLAANALISKLFGVNPLKELISGIKDAGKAFLGLGKDAEGAGDSLGTKLGNAAAAGIKKSGSGISKAASSIGDVFSETIIPAVILAGGAIVDAFWTYIGFPLAAAIGTLAGILGLPVEVVIAIIVAAILIIVGVIYLIWTNWQTIWGWIQAAFDAVVGAIVAVWNTLFDIFKAPVEFIWQFISAIFILIVAIIAIALEAIFKLVVGTVLLIYNILAAIAGWINTNVIQPVWQFFQWLWDTITNAVVAAWQWIFDNVLRPIGTWVYNNVILPVARFFQGLWDGIIGALKAFINTFYGPFSAAVTWLKVNIIDPIFNFFQGLWDRILQGLKNMWSSLTNIFGTLGGVIKAPINGVITLINDVLKQLNKIKVPDWVPGLGGKGVNFPMIPLLAKGGIVQDATLAVLGESGAEAVMPLENNTEWIDTLASKLNKGTNGNGNQPVQLIVQIGEDKVASKIIELINEKTNMSGRNTIFV